MYRERTMVARDVPGDAIENACRTARGGTGACARISRAIDLSGLPKTGPKRRWDHATGNKHNHVRISLGSSQDTACARQPRGVKVRNLPTNRTSSAAAPRQTLLRSIVGNAFFKVIGKPPGRSLRWPDHCSPRWKASPRLSR